MFWKAKGFADVPAISFRNDICEFESSHPSHAVGLYERAVFPASLGTIARIRHLTSCSRQKSISTSRYIVVAAKGLSRSDSVLLCRIAANERIYVEGCQD